MPNFLDIGNNDFMNRSAALRIHGVKRAYFDPANKAHCQSLKVFLETGGWGDIMFFPEFPYTEVPATVLAKFARYRLKTTSQKVKPTTNEDTQVAA